MKFDKHIHHYDAEPLSRSVISSPVHVTRDGSIATFCVDETRVTVYGLPEAALRAFQDGGIVYRLEPQHVEVALADALQRTAIPAAQRGDLPRGIGSSHILGASVIVDALRAAGIDC